MRPNRWRRLGIGLLLAASAPDAGAQEVGGRTPNLTTGWTAPPGVVQFNFIHRFAVSGPPLRKVTNSPTFMVGTGVVEGVMAGFNYASNSALVPAYPNEWELFGRAIPISQSRGDLLDLSVQVGYNVASESVDGELMLSRSLGPLRLLGAGRYFSRAFATAEGRWAVAGGAVVQLTERISLAGDYAVLVDRAEDEADAWGAGVQIGVPYTPHSLSLQVSNVGMATLEGASRGDETRWGFEYTVPINLGRYLGGSDAGRRTDRPQGPAEPVGGPDTAPAAASADTVTVEIMNLRYGEEDVEIQAGTTVVWTNRDPLDHTVTSDDGLFDSGLVTPEGTWSMTFSTPGTYEYHCTPHPFMQARIRVLDAGEMP